MTAHIIKPMLATSDLVNIDTDVRLPVMVSPKLDGIRAIMRDGKVWTRKLKPIPNRFITAWCEANLPDGFDGELLLRDWTAPFKEVSSAVMSRGGAPDFTYAAFDCIFDDMTPEMPFRTRYARLENMVASLTFNRDQIRDRLFRVRQWEVDDLDEVRALHAGFLGQHFEGSILKDPESVYKFGRSTLKQGWMLKLKKWRDEEATVIGFEEQMHNGNEATKDALGNTKRSTHKANKTGKGTLGSLRLRFDDGAEFGCGSGLNDEEKQAIWDTQADFLGMKCKIKHQEDPRGRQPGELPRIPVFLGWRED